jgi:hypothetical protein
MSVNTENQKKQKTKKQKKFLAQQKRLSTATLFPTPSRKKLTDKNATNRPSGGRICKDAFVEAKRKRDASSKAPRKGREEGGSEERRGGRGIGEDSLPREVE